MEVVEWRVTLGRTASMPSPDAAARHTGAGVARRQAHHERMRDERAREAAAGDAELPPEDDTVNFERRPRAGQRGGGGPELHPAAQQGDEGEAAEATARGCLQSNHAPHRTRHIVPVVHMTAGGADDDGHTRSAAPLPHTDHGAPRARGGRTRRPPAPVRGAQTRDPQ